MYPASGNVAQEKTLGDKSCHNGNHNALRLHCNQDLGTLCAPENWTTPDSNLREGSGLPE